MQTQTATSIDRFGQHACAYVVGAPVGFATTCRCHVQTTFSHIIEGLEGLKFYTLTSQGFSHPKLLCEVSLPAAAMDDTGDLRQMELSMDTEDGLTLTNGAEENLADEEPPQPSEEVPCRKRKRKSAGTAETQQSKGAGGEETLQKCNSFCGKTKPLSEYWKDQKKCKECVLHQRAFWRHAEKQGVQQDMKDLESESPQTFKDVLKGFLKERTRAAAADGKIKFSMTAFKKSLQGRSGDRREDEKVMMWEGQWLEEARKAAHGFLTKEEAEAKWAGWLADETVRKDNLGPRGYMRVAVPTRTVVLDFDEVAEQRELTQSERLPRGAKADTLEARKRMVVAGNVDRQTETIAGVSISDVRSKARATAVDMEEMMAPNIASYAEAAKKRRRLSGKGKEEESDSKSDKPAGEEEESQEEAKEEEKAGKNKNKWFDAETKCRKAERSWISSVEGLEKALNDLLKECKEVADGVQASPDDRSTFAEELQILERRRRWVEAVLGGSEQLEKLMEEQAAEDKKSMDEAKTTSQDLTALTRVGPCKDYKELKSIQTLKSMGADFRACSSNAAIKQTNELCSQEKKYVSTLMAAVKAAKTDLQAAKKRQEAMQKKEEEKAAKAERAAAKAAAASGTSGPSGRRKSAGGEGAGGFVTRKRVSGEQSLFNSELWQDASRQIATVQSFADLDAGDFCMPWIQSGVNAPEDALRSLKEFGKVFAGSALRVTEGRAQSALGPATANLMQSLAEQKCVPNGFFLDLPGSGAHVQALQPVMKTSSFGFAASSISSGRTELGMLPCLRLFCEGSLMVAVLTPALSKFGDASVIQTVQSIMTEGNQEKLQTAAESGELRVATVGKGDLLYLPPACVCSHKAHSADVLGVRSGILSRAFNHRLQSLLDGAASGLPAPMKQAIQQAIEEQKDGRYEPVEMPVDTPPLSPLGLGRDEESPMSEGDGFEEKEKPEGSKELTSPAASQSQVAPSSADAGGNANAMPNSEPKPAEPAQVPAQQSTEAAEAPAPLAGPEASGASAKLVEENFGQAPANKADAQEKDDVAAVAPPADEKANSPEKKEPPPPADPKEAESLQRPSKPAADLQETKELSKAKEPAPKAEAVQAKAKAKAKASQKPQKDEEAKKKKEAEKAKKRVKSKAFSGASAAGSPAKPVFLANVKADPTRSG